MKIEIAIASRKPAQICGSAAGRTTFASSGMPAARAERACRPHQARFDRARAVIRRDDDRDQAAHDDDRDAREIARAPPQHEDQDQRRLRHRDTSSSGADRSARTAGGCGPSRRRAERRCRIASSEPDGPASARRAEIRPKAGIAEQPEHADEHVGKRRHAADRNEPDARADFPHEQRDRDAGKRQQRAAGAPGSVRRLPMTVMRRVLPARSSWAQAGDAGSHRPGRRASPRDRAAVRCRRRSRL